MLVLPLERDLPVADLAPFLPAVHLLHPPLAETLMAILPAPTLSAVDLNSTNPALVMSALEKAVVVLPLCLCVPAVASVARAARAPRTTSTPLT